MCTSRVWSVLLCVLAFALGVASCSQGTQEGESGSLSLQHTIGGDIEIDEVDWLITGGDMEPMCGTIDTSAPDAIASVEVFGLPPTIDEDYTIVMEAVSMDGTTCKSSEDFGIDVGEVTEIMTEMTLHPPTSGRASSQLKTRHHRFDGAGFSAFTEGQLYGQILHTERATTSHFSSALPLRSSAMQSS